MFLNSGASSGPFFSALPVQEQQLTVWKTLSLDMWLKQRWIFQAKSNHATYLFQCCFLPFAAYPWDKISQSLYTVPKIEVPITDHSPV